MNHEVFRSVLISAEANALRRALLSQIKDRQERYEKAYRMITESMRQCRGTYGWIPLVLYDRSRISGATGAT